MIAPPELVGTEVVSASSGERARFVALTDEFSIIVLRADGTLDVWIRYHATFERPKPPPVPRPVPMPVPPGGRRT